MPTFEYEGRTYQIDDVDTTKESVAFYVTGAVALAPIQWSESDKVTIDAERVGLIADIGLTVAAQVFKAVTARRIDPPPITA